MNYTNLKDESTNNARIAGKICSEVTKSHEIEGEDFYEFKVAVGRLSKINDVIPVTISGRTLMGNVPKEGDFVEINGEYRSYNKFQNEKSRLILHLFAKDFKVLPSEQEFINEVKLTGYICKEPVYRKTPFEREICDVLLAVNRPNYHKSDYIPCIMWGRNARYTAKQEVGCKMEITGRIQSREYNKTFPDGTTTNKTAYEVSCQLVKILDNVEKISAANSEEKEKVVNN